MATVNIKKEDGTYERVADTLGMLVPVDVSECYARRPSGTLQVVGDSPVKLPIVYNEGQQWVNASNEVVVPETGYYLIDHIVYIEGGSTAPQARYTSVYRNGADSLRANTVEMAITATAWTNPHFAGVRRLNAGDRLTLTAWATNSTTMNVNSAHLYVTLLKKDAPYLVANKGALVSGGAFRFDDAGNCYPEIYSTDEVKCGVWIDGKFIYRKTYYGTWGTTGTLKTVTVESGFISNKSVDTVVKMEGVARVRSFELASTLSGIYADDWTAIGYGAGITSSGNLVVYARQIDNASYKWHLTIFYTKTTD
jgi:hypothetical protein